MSDDFVFGNATVSQTVVPNKVRLTGGGIIHRSARMPRSPKPGEHVRLELQVTEGIDFEQAWVYFITDGRDPLGRMGKATRGAVLPMQPSDVVWNPETKVYERLFQVFLPGQERDTVVRYCLSANSPTRGEVFADNGTIYAYLVSDRNPPVWSWDAVLYHIFVDRFAAAAGSSLDPTRPLDGFMGGCLKGITRRLDSLAALGVNTLYLSPVFASPSYHGYDATDYFEIETRLGVRADFRELLDQAHARSMHVLLDFVPNHCSDRHPIFQSAIRDQRSPYRKWFVFNAYPDDYKTFFGVRSMPCFNLRNEKARAYILDAARSWLDFGVDGYRLDYAIGPAPDFWAELRRSIHASHPEAWVFGEVADSPDVQLSFHGLLDGCLDFKLMDALRNTFAYGTWKATDLAVFLARHQAFFPEDFSRPSFLDNHDMDRFLWAAGGEKRKLKLAALCQFTLSGAPILYYGTEVGLSQRRSVTQENMRFGILEEARLPMLFEKEEQDEDLLAFFTGLIRFRKSNPVCAYGAWTLLAATPEVLAYSRTDEKQKIAVVLNTALRENVVSLPGIWDTPVFHSGPGAEIHLHAGNTEIRIPPLTGMVVG